jgi:hypothetical protein
MHDEPERAWTEFDRERIDRTADACSDRLNEIAVSDPETLEV